MASSFHDRFVKLFNVQFERLYRYLNRLSGDAELAADLAQEAFVRLYARGEIPDDPAAWLITVALNLLRNEKASGARRHQLLVEHHGQDDPADRGPSPAEAVVAAEARSRVRATLGRLSRRDRQLLLLHAEGHSYREIARALDLTEASVGTFLARAKRAFRDAHDRAADRADDAS